MPKYKYGITVIEYTLDYKSEVKDILISVEWFGGVRVVSQPSIDDTKLREVLLESPHGT